MALTKQDITKIEKLFDTKFEAQKEHLEKRMDQKFEEQKQYIDDKLTAQRQYVDDKIDQKVDSLRVLIEDVRSDIKLLAEGIGSVTQKYDQQEQKIVNHEKRITTLEDFTYSHPRPK